MGRTPWWVWASVILSAGLSLWSMSYRYRVEQRNRAVTICAEMVQIEQLAAAQGESKPEGIARLKDAGLGGVAVGEDTLGSLVEEGQLVQQSDFLLVGNQSRHSDVGFKGETQCIRRVEEALKQRFPKLRFSTDEGPAGITTMRVGGWTVELSATSLKTLSLGTDPETVKLLNSEGMLVVARMANPTGVNDSTISWLIGKAGPSGGTVFLPMGDQVLGRRDNLDTLIDALRTNGILYASPEFAKLGGDANVVAKAPDLVVRLHSAQAAELDKLPLDDAVERYSRAASERNQRVLLLRPLSFSSPRPLDSFAEFVSAVRKQLQKEGLSVGKALPFEDPATPQWLFPAIGLAAAPAMFFAASAFLSGALLQLLVGLIILALGGGAVLHQVKPLTALACATAFPVLAYLILGSAPKRQVPVSYVLMSVVSLAGGLCVAGLLNGLPYLVRAEQFVGVKLAHFAPVGLVGGWFLYRFTNARQALGSPVRWTHGILALVIVAGLGLMFLRTGNENPFAVSDIELRFRALLDQILFVRPRTKEFFIGHPALFVGLAMLVRSVRCAEKGEIAPFAGWTVLALTLGAIGQTSIVNTMCHLHTPLTVGLTRIGVGLVLGGILGALLWAVIVRFLPKEEA